MSDQRPDIEAERPDFERNALSCGLSVDRNDTGSYLMAVTEYRWRGWKDRARIAAERERELQYAADQHDLCCEAFGVGKSPDDPGDTLFERMNRWKRLMADQAIQISDMQDQIDILDAALKAKFRLDTRHPLLDGLVGISCDNGTLLATVLEQKGENDMLLDLLREAQDVVCRNRCQFQSKLGTHVEHCDLCQRISAVLAGKGPSNDT